MSNRLSEERSPYLLQHADNPVDWYPWGDEAFRRARAEDKPVFLSIGYSTCHWCHVMARESFANEEIASLLNRDFICVKVDREERPDVDAVYMAACQAMNGSGGWPLTILMTPAQQPFFAATYLPPHSDYGMTGLDELLPAVAAQWRDNREALLQAGAQIADFLRGRAEETQQPTAPDRALLRLALRQFRDSYDAAHGGFGAAPKFPVPHDLLFLLRYSALENAPQAREMALHTLTQMYRGGIFDHIGGGFSRYATDARWLIPHFEKMLYDNALLLLAYGAAYCVSGDALYREVAERVAGYLLRDLLNEAGGFSCGQDADSDGEEGKYYLFTQEELERVLGPADGALFSRWYGVGAAGNFAGKSVPHLLENADFRRAEPRLDVIRAKLYPYRKQRFSLHLDDKALTSWNALAILALARAATALGQPRYLQAARRCQQFIAKHLTAPDGRLFLRWRDGEAAHAGQLDDYAYYAYALLALYDATFDAQYLAEAQRVVALLCELFADARGGGFFLSAADAERLLYRPKETYDGALPSGNSIAALALCRLAQLSGEPRWQQARDAQLAFLAGNIRSYPMQHSAALLALSAALYPETTLVCATAEDAPPAGLSALLAAYDPLSVTALVKTKANAARLAAFAPFTDAYPLPSRGAAYYLCRNKTCRPPVTDLAQLKDMLDKA